MKKEKKVSIIIRTKNEERWINSCLRKVFRQTYKNIEVIIVDNNSTDHTLEIAKSFPVKVINIDIFFPGMAINDGIRATSGELIVCLSAHCIPVNEFWLEELISNLEDPDIAGVYGRQEPLSFTSDVDKRDLLTVFGLDKRVQVKDSFFHNANSAFRREIWERFKFDEGLTNIEDRVWGDKVIKAGLKIVYEPNSSVYHWHGINQDLNSERAKNVVRILETLESLNSQKNQNSLKDIEVVAVIPVRGNTSLFGSKSLLEYSIKVAQNSDYITNVIVATDNEEAYDAAKLLGAEVYMRPEDLSNVYVTSMEVVGYVVDELKKSERHYDVVVLLEEVYPFRDKDLIDNMISQLIHQGQDTVVAALEEKRNIWIQDEKDTTLLNCEEGPLMPNALKQTRALIGMLGICCVTRPEMIRNNSVLDGKVGIYEIDNQISAMTVRKDTDKHMRESMSVFLSKFK
jgi:CMP-N-acetylneuraminic acid synthetase/GT2 family glycosyltransferase